MTELNAQNRILGSGYLIFLFAILIRWCIALHSYSGEKTPPMFGDYEAQRHWMEITYNVPIQDWYRNTKDNNLTYWGLDYPPLTAYHSYVCGLVASFAVPNSIKLHSSRGYENYSHKFFMRATVLIVDVLLYIPAIFFYFKNYRKQNASTYMDGCTLLTLLYPGLVLIDHGHFQYNCVSLGLFVAAVNGIMTKHFRIATVLFCLAVNYKQMELYHSLPFFVFFVGKFLLKWRKQSFMASVRFIAPVSVLVIGVFFTLWFPFLNSVEDAQQVVRRIFPIQRGIYEDKVASFWCVLNIFYKLRNLSNETMFQLSLVVTLTSALPSLLNLVINPTIEKFRLALINCSLGFFLFSYHVHEKSILLVAVPVALEFPKQPLISFWFLFISTFSMLPLLIKDGLFLPFLALSVLYYLLFVSIFFKSNALVCNVRFEEENFSLMVVKVSILCCTLLTGAARFLPAPSRYPYLWPLLVSVYSFVHFFGFLLYYNCKQFGIEFKRNRF